MVAWGVRLLPKFLNIRRNRKPWRCPHGTAVRKETAIGHPPLQDQIFTHSSSATKLLPTNFQPFLFARLWGGSGLDFDFRMPESKLALSQLLYPPPAWLSRFTLILSFTLMCQKQSSLQNMWPPIINDRQDFSFRVKREQMDCLHISEPWYRHLIDSTIQISFGFVDVKEFCLKRGEALMLRWMKTVQVSPVGYQRGRWSRKCAPLIQMICLSLIVVLFLISFALCDSGFCKCPDGVKTVLGHFHLESIKCSITDVVFFS